METRGLLRLTMACQERCPFCNVPAESYAQLTPPLEQTLAELDRFAASGQKMLTISGGEPTLLRKRLLRVLDEARARGLEQIELQTNALLVDGGYARELAAGGVTSAFVSLMSHRAEVPDRLAGYPGAFEPCLAGMDALDGVGIRVTPNLVVARETQGEVAEILAFIGERLPYVRTVSLSAVQPHGRASGGADELVPDYAVLREEVPRARAVAARNNILLVNPYCGLPLCIGWADQAQVSAEAVEAGRGGWREVPGLENTGDKTHGAPCLGCAVRTRCGGAWKAYWAVRAGSGIAPPLRSAPPWRASEGDEGAQVVLRGLDESGDAPTVWLHRRGLGAGDAERILASRVTDLGLELRVEGRRPSREVLVTLREVKALVSAGRAAQPQTRLRVWLALGRTGSPAMYEVLAWARDAGLDGLEVVSETGSDR